MSIPRTCLMLPLLAACAGGQLAELEEEHEALREEYDDLQANVEALRREMVDLGLLTEAQANARVQPGSKSAKGSKSGKRPRGPGNARPETELSAALPWSASREGAPPDLVPLPAPVRAGGDCGWKITNEDLQPLSDFPLNRDGYGKSSPVLLLEDEQPLAAHAMPEAFEGACAGAFRHAGYLFLFSPNGTVDDGGRRSYRAALAPDFPLARGEDERPMYWVYPGTTATFAFQGAWDEAWGEPRLTIAGRTAIPGPGAATLAAPGVEQELDQPGDFAVSEVLALEGGAFEVVVRSESGGPYVLIDTLTLGNPQNAVVVTAEAAWAARTR